MDLNDYSDLDEYEEYVIKSIVLGNENWFSILVEEYNNKIKVNKITLDNKYGIKISDSYNVLISNYNYQKIKKDLFDDESKIKNINQDDLTKIKLSYIMVIIHNDESFIVDSISNKELIFEISSKRVNCPTGILKVYNNNSFEYIYGHDSNKELIRTGTFDYDINLLINNLKNNVPNERQPFILTLSDQTYYYVYDNNIELQSFLTKINVDLDTCIVNY